MSKTMVEYTRGSQYRRRSARLLAKKLVAATPLHDLVADPTAGDDLLLAAWHLVKEKFLDDALHDTLLANKALGLKLVDVPILEKAILNEISKVIVDSGPHMQTAVERVAFNVDRFTRPPAPAIDWSKAKTGVPIRGKVYLASRENYGPK